MKKIIIIGLLTFSILGCKKNDLIINQKNDIEKIISLNSDKKLFLDYFEDMTQEQYELVTRKLAIDKKIEVRNDSVLYVFDNAPFAKESRIIPIFEHHKLKAIQIEQISEWNKFKKQYPQTKSFLDSTPITENDLLQYFLELYTVKYKSPLKKSYHYSIYNTINYYWKTNTNKILLRIRKISRSNMQIVDEMSIIYGGVNYQGSLFSKDSLLFEREQQEKIEYQKKTVKDSLNILKEI